MSQVAATLSSRLEKAEQTHPQPICSKFYCHLDHVLPGAKYITGEGWPHPDMPVPHTEREKAGEGEEDMLVICNINWSNVQR